MPASRTIPAWLDRSAYPFTPRAFATPRGDMSYVDEGEGEVIVFVHGNPTWSFMYRGLIKGLQSRYRCVAPDHLGFGLSDKPRGASYLPQMHAQCQAALHNWSRRRLACLLAGGAPRAARRHLTMP